MLSKILLTVVVIIGAAWYLRTRQRPAAPSPAVEGGISPMFWAAVAVVALGLGGSALFGYLDWREEHRVMQVAVVNANSGHRAEYHAYRQDIGERSFRTVEGQVVSLAEVERMEVSEATDDPPR